MGRRYTKEEYLNLFTKIKENIPGVSITTDIIVGHPYETEKLFLETIKTCKEINFSKIHVFPYSKRLKITWNSACIFLCARAVLLSFSGVDFSSKKLLH